jgi:hypothetical protein
MKENVMMEVKINISARTLGPEKKEEPDGKYLNGIKGTDVKNTKFSSEGNARTSWPIEGGEGRETVGSIQIVLMEFTSDSAEQNIDSETVGLR